MKEPLSNNSSPLVSVIIPAFNASNTIAQAIESVLCQTMPDLELIVCDDASTDRTQELVKSFQDCRLKYIKNNINLGAGLSRDHAIKYATAPWVALIDADDVWAPNRLEMLLDCAKGYPDSLVFDDILVCHNSVDNILIPWGSLHGVKAFGGNGSKARNLGVESYLASSRLLIKPLIPLSLVREFMICHSKRTFGEDAEYFLKFALVGARFRYLPEPLYLYRVQSGSATARSDVGQMRECIEECAAWEGWSISAQEAFKKKIISLRHNEAMYSIVDDVKKGRLFAAIKTFIKKPALIKLFPPRLFKHLMYQLHRLRHNGENR